MLLQFGVCWPQDPLETSWDKLAEEFRGAFMSHFYFASTPSGVPANPPGLFSMMVTYLWDLYGCSGLCESSEMFPNTSSAQTNLPVHPPGSISCLILSLSYHLASSCLISSNLMHLNCVPGCLNRQREVKTLPASMRTMGTWPMDI